MAEMTVDEGLGRARDARREAATREVEAANALQQRSDYARLIESLLYESADSYNAARIAYLQNRSASLNQGAPAAEDLEDPYAFE